MTVVKEHETTSMVPHLLPAMRNWMLENDFIPEILLDVTVKGTDVPLAFAKNDVLIISIHPRGCSHVNFTEHGVEIGTRFNRVHTDCFVPYDAIMGLRARSQPIMVPFNTQRVKIDKKTEEQRRIDQIDVGQVEFGGEIKPTRAGRFGVVQGSKLKSEE